MLGDFTNTTAVELGATAIRAAVARAGVDFHSIDEVIFGNCLMAGQGQAPARQAALAAGLPYTAGAVTLSKMCGAGLKSVMLAHDMLVAGSADVLLQVVWNQ
jgi:acetyl-CoA C-acetyltransferase